jgi:hypothetical protein
VSSSVVVEHPVAHRDRTAVWLPLLETLTRERSDWIVLKNAAAALAGLGDVDTFAPPPAWPAIETTFRRWADEQGLLAVATCRHNWRGPNFIAIGADDPYIWSLDVKRLRTFRGSCLITVESALALAAPDDGDFRRLRPGAEGVLKLLFNGLRPGGHPNEDGLRRKGVVDALRADPSGAFQAAELVGAAAPALRRGIRAVLDGDWSRRDMLAVETWSLGRSALRPDYAVRQLWMRWVVFPTCPVVRLPDRRVPDDRAAWLRAMDRTHRGSSYLPHDGARA